MNLVRSELLKIRTTRMWWGLLIGAVLFAVLGACITAAIAGSGDPATSAGNPAAGIWLDDPAMLRSVYSQGFQGAYLFAMILGIVGMTGEYRHQTITPTFLVTLGATTWWSPRSSPTPPWGFSTASSPRSRPWPRAAR